MNISLSIEQINHLSVAPYFKKKIAILPVQNQQGVQKIYKIATVIGPDRASDGTTRM